MTAPGRYATSDSSFARSAGGAAARGGILIAVAVILGVLLLWQGFDGGDESAAIPADVDPGPDDNGGTANADEPTDETSDETTDDEGDTPTDEEGGTSGEDPGVDPPVTVEVDPPESVKVAVLNGRGESGLGKAGSDALIALGYVAKGVNAVSFDNELSRVYYTLGYEDEAEVVVEAFNAGPSVLDEAPADPLALVAEDFREEVADFHIFVMLGADAALL